MNAKIALTSDYDDVRVAIRRKFVHDCTSGNRSRLLPAGVFASGQYFDLPERTQRGLHGTAAALRVLAEESSRDEPSREVAAGIVRYVGNRAKVETDLLGANVHSQELLCDKLRHDNTSTIKQAELLYALGFVTHGVAGADDLRTEVTERLTAGRSDDGGGWFFTLEPAKRSSDFVTAHVVRALLKNGHPCKPWVGWLRTGLLQRSGAPRNDALTNCLDTFVLQVLVAGEAIGDTEGRVVFDSLWQALQPSLASRREANIDFFDGDRQNFVRIPWQLHLSVCAAYLHPYRRYLGTDVQQVLSAVCRDVTSREGFRYPESGQHLSTRLYGYIYDAVALITRQRSAYRIVDRWVASLTGRAAAPARTARIVARVLLMLASLGVIGIGTWSWLNDRNASISELAPNFVAAAVLGVLGWYFGRQTKK